MTSKNSVVNISTLKLFQQHRLMKWENERERERERNERKKIINSKRKLRDDEENWKHFKRVKMSWEESIKNSNFDNFSFMDF